jgi:hypothetical protein
MPLPFSASSSPGRARRGLTILEMLVSTAMLSLIVLGLTAMFIQVQKAFKSGIKQTDVTDTGRTIMEMVANDLRQLSDAKNPGVPNLFWSWSGTNQLAQGSDGVMIRTNQQDELFILVHTNNVWTGIGYAVSNVGPCLGTLYRYSVSTNAHYITNNLFLPFQASVNNQSFGTNWHAVADGVIHLKLRAYDQNGNENWFQSKVGDYTAEDSAPEFSYPPSYLLGPNTILFNPNSNTLPHSVELELAVLEPDAFNQAHAMAFNPTAVANFLATNAVNKVDVFRQRITIPLALQ